MGKTANPIQLTVLIFLGACSGGASRGNGPGDTPAGQPVPVTGTPDSPTQVTKGSGTVLATPRLQLITFNNDIDAGTLEDFTTKLATSTYWTATTQEYGVGALTVATPVRATQAWPVNATGGDLDAGQNSDIETYLAAQLDGTTPALGAPVPNTVYVLVMPSGTTVSTDGNSAVSACAVGVYGWHTAMTLPVSGTTVDYIVIPSCGALGNLTELQSRTVALSHEIIGAVTNPHLDGYNSYDPNHRAWFLAGGGGEPAAACVAEKFGSSDINTQPADLPYTVQRSWSNTAARENRPACVPAPSKEVLFSAWAGGLSLVSAALTADPLVAPVQTSGMTLAAGAQATVPVHLYSAGEVGTWTVTATEVGSSALTLSLDKATGTSGDTLHLSVSVGSAPTSQQELVRITSTYQNISNSNYFVVHQ